LTPTGNRPIRDQLGGWWWVVFVIALAILVYVAIGGG